MRKFLSILTVGMLAATPALAGGYTAEQKREIGQIVRQYLLQNPEILYEMQDVLQRRQDMQRIAHAESAFGDLFKPKPLDPVVGAKNGKKVLIEFFDYNCGFCKRMLPMLRKLVKEDPGVTVILKEFPILSDRTEGGSKEASLAALAVHRLYPDKYWEFHSKLLGFQGIANGKVALKIARQMGLDTKRIEEEMKKPELEQALQNNEILGQLLGIRGTPAFVTSARQVIPGAVDYRSLVAALNKRDEKKAAAARQ